MEKLQDIKLDSLGRKYNKNYKEPKTDFITVKLSKSLKNIIMQIAFDNNLPVSAVVRYYMMKGMEEN